MVYLVPVLQWWSESTWSFGVQSCEPTCFFFYWSKGPVCDTGASVAGSSLRSHTAAKQEISMINTPEPHSGCSLCVAYSNYKKKTLEIRSWTHSWDSFFWTCPGWTSLLAWWSWMLLGSPSYLGRLIQRSLFDTCSLSRALTAEQHRITRGHSSSGERDPDVSRKIRRKKLQNFNLQ